MRKTFKAGAAALVAAGMLAAGPAFTALADEPQAASARGDSQDRGRRNALMVVGLTDDGRLVRFRDDNPSNPRGSVPVSGLAGDAGLVGIDYRVQNGLLYGVGDAGGIYTLDAYSGNAVKVSQLSVALEGTEFGVDFNPAANRLRVISDTGQNLRHNIDDSMGMPAAGVTAEDGPLSTPPAEGATAGVTGAAYTNNDLDPNTATTLYDIATATDQVVLQSPANAGTLAATGNLTVDAATPSGFDSYSTVRHGTTVDVMALATLQVGGRWSLYEITLFSGKATSRGGYPRGTNVVDIAIPLNQL